MFIIGKLKNTFSPGMLALTDVGTVTNNGGTLRIDVKRNLYYEYDFVKNEWKVVNGISVKHITKNFEIDLNFDNIRVLDNTFFDLVARDKYSLMTDYEREQFINSYYRHRREIKCYPIINRGKLWYDLLTEARYEQLENWYHSWLDVTETHKEPDDLYWFNEKLTKPEEIIL